MSEKTKIEWCHSSWSPWQGCEKVSPGCKNCYMMAMRERYGKRGNVRERHSVSYWKQPLRWSDRARKEHRAWQTGIEYLKLSEEELIAKGFIKPTRPRVFPSLCDWLDDGVPVEWLADFLELIRQTPYLDWLLLTKRPENWNDRLTKVYCLTGETNITPTNRWIYEWLHGRDIPSNVWIGVSVENQATANERIPLLLDIPAAVRFVSYEPALDPVDFQCNFWLTGQARRKDKSLMPPHSRSCIDWIIVGGESGEHRRDCGVDALIDATKQGIAAGVPVFVKQDCAYASGQQGRIPDDIWALKQFPTVKVPA